MAKNKTNEFFGNLPIDYEKTLGAFTIEELKELQRIKDRVLILNTDIGVEDLFDSVSDIILNIIKYNEIDKGIDPEKRKPILFYINSNGGSLYDGLGLLDVVKTSTTPIYTIALGKCFSMAFLLFLAGSKRFTYQHSSFLLHEGTSFGYNSTNKLLDQAEFTNKSEKQIKDFVVKNTKISSKTYEKNLRKEWYMTANEAIKYGVADYMIGVDVAADEIR